MCIRGTLKRPRAHRSLVKYVRITGSPDPDLVPEAFRLIAASEHVTAARAVSTKFAGRAGASALFHVEGDRQALEAGLDGPPEVDVAETAPADGDGFFLFLVLDPSAVPVMQAMFDVLSWRELVVVPPVVYRDGSVHAQVVGTAATVGSIVDALGDAVEVEVHAVGERGLDAEPGPTALSDRQREAVRAALELGYYDQPRGGTHEDVAAALSCAPSTASEHLRKAEAKLVRSAMGVPGGAGG
jgi:predicted DNA binding protein